MSEAPSEMPSPEEHARRLASFAEYTARLERLLLTSGSGGDQGGPDHWYLERDPETGAITVAHDYWRIDFDGVVNLQGMDTLRWPLTEAQPHPPPEVWRLVVEAAARSQG